MGYWRQLAVISLMVFGTTACSNLSEFVRCFVFVCCFLINMSRLWNNHQDPRTYENIWDILFWFCSSVFFLLELAMWNPSSLPHVSILSSVRMFFSLTDWTRQGASDLNNLLVMGLSPDSMASWILEAICYVRSQTLTFNQQNLDIKSGSSW